MNRATRFAIIVFSAAFSCSFFVQSQNRIEGRLHPPSGRTLSGGASITLQRASGSQVGSTQADGTGRFSFDSLAPGDYNLSVRADGFYPVRQEVEIPSGYIQNIVSVMISLVPLNQGDSRDEKLEKAVPVESLKIPDEAVDKVDEAEKAAAKGNYQRAVECAQRAVELAPAYFQAVNNLAVYYYHLRERERALQLFKKASELNPEAINPLLNLGRVLLEERNPEEALPVVERAIQLRSTSSEAHYLRGRALVMSGKFRESIGAFRRALELDSPIEHARFFLAHALYEVDETREGVAQLELYIRNTPSRREELGGRLDDWKKKLQ